MTYLRKILTPCKEEKWCLSLPSSISEWVHLGREDGDAELSWPGPNYQKCL